MSYLRYFKSLVKYRHPRLSYMDNFTPAYTRPIVKFNVPIVYALFAVFASFEVYSYKKAIVAQRKAIELPK